jgi:hypothetical protein
MPDSNHNAIEASLQVGDAELTPKPKVAAKVIKISERAEAARAPAMIGVHCKLQRAFSVGSRDRPSPITGASMVIGSLLSQAEEGQYRQHYDNQTYEIDYAIHIALSLQITACVIS